MEETNCELENFKMRLIGIDTIKEENEIIDAIKTEDGEEATDDTKERIPLINIDSIKKEEKYLVDEMKEQETKIADVIKTEDNGELEDIKNYLGNNKKDKLHECNLCQKTFSDISCLKRHLLVFPTGQRSACHICHETFSNCFSFQKHLKEHRENPYECNLCHKAFAQIPTLKKHLSTHVEEKLINKTANKCKICHKIFPQQKHLEKHFLAHIEKIPYKFTECLKSTSNHREGQLTVHTGEKQFKCKICCKTFSQSICLEKHLLIHQINTEEKSYECEICQKTFTREHLLQRHVQKIHTEVKEYECNISDAFKKSLKRNFQIRIGEKSHLS